MRTTVLRIKKTAQGKYVLYKDGDKVLTATFAKKYRPMPMLPVGYELTVRVKGRVTLKKVVKSIAEGKRRMLSLV